MICLTNSWRGRDMGKGTIPVLTLRHKHTADATDPSRMRHRPDRQRIISRVLFQDLDQMDLSECPPRTTQIHHILHDTHSLIATADLGMLAVQVSPIS